MFKVFVQKNIIFAIISLLFTPFIVSAQVPRLEVTFTPDPLFSETSVLPGDNISGTVRVTNNSGEDQVVITESINVSDPNLLSNQMILEILDENANIFFDANDGTFFNFLSGGVQTLTNPLPDGGSVTYTFSVSFPDTVGNEFQETELGFDLCVGFVDELSGMNCGNTVVSGDGNTGGGTDTGGDGGTTIEGTGGTGPGGGGGTVDLVSLQISNERVVSIDDVTGTALIAWETNLFSTSQVVYGITSEGPYSLQPLLFNFGYPITTVEDQNKVISHTAVLSGLISGEDYSFRVVSRASPPTVSFEHDFTVEKIGSTPIPEPTPIATEPTEGDVSGGASVPSKQPNTSSGSILAISNVEEGRSGASDDAEGVVEDISKGASITDERQEELEALVDALPNLTSEGEGEEGLPIAKEGFAAAAFFSGVLSNDLVSCVSVAFLTIMIVYLVQAFLSKMFQKYINNRTKNIILFGGLLAAAILMLLLSKLCSFTLILIFILAMIVWNLYQSREENENNLSKNDGILHKKPLS